MARRNPAPFSHALTGPSRYGLTPVQEMFGEWLPKRTQSLVTGDYVQLPDGRIQVFVGTSYNGEPWLVSDYAWTKNETKLRTDLERKRYRLMSGFPSLTKAEKKQQELAKRGLGTRLHRSKRNGTRPPPGVRPREPGKGEMVCRRCGGTGWLDVFSHVEQGICFKCQGSGVHAYEAPSRREPVEREAPWPRKEVTLIGNRWTLLKWPKRENIYLLYLGRLHPNINPDFSEGIDFELKNGKVIMPKGTNRELQFKLLVQEFRRLPEVDFVRMDSGDFDAADRVWAEWYALLERIRRELQSRFDSKRR